MKSDPRYNFPWLTPEKANYLLLNGDWKFNYVATPDKRPMDFWKENFDLSNGKTIEVLPIGKWKDMEFLFTQRSLSTFKYASPYLGAQVIITVRLMPTRLIIQTLFWIARRVGSETGVCYFGGIYSAALVWVTELTSAIQKEKNNDHQFDIYPRASYPYEYHSVQVIRLVWWSYRECQDISEWRYYRDVYLTTTTKTFVRDHYIQSTLNAADSYTTGTLKVTTEVDNRDKTAVTKKVGVTLLDHNGNVVRELPVQTVTFAAGDSTSSLVFNATDLTGLQLWTAETPVLYTVISHTYDSGWSRRISLLNQIRFPWCDNPKILSCMSMVKRIRLKGVNRHDTDPMRGRAVCLLHVARYPALQANNINTLRHQSLSQSG